MIRRWWVAMLVACLVVPAGAAPSAAAPATGDATCRVELAAVHQRLRGFGVAQIGGTVDVVAASSCLDLSHQPFTVSGAAWVEILDPATAVWTRIPETMRWCSAPSAVGAAVSTCSASWRYSDPALTDATFRGCFDLETPVDLPVRCLAPINTP